MSKNSKIIMWVVIVIIVIFLGWWYVAASTSAPAMSAPANGDVNSSAPVSMDTNQNSVPENGLTTSSDDSSDAALNSDLSTIDTQRGGLSSDSTNIDQSMNSNTSTQ